MIPPSEPEGERVLASVLPASTERGTAGSKPTTSATARDERQMLDALARGDWNATLSALMSAYGPQVYRYCRQLLSDGNLAEDALQETFVRAHRGLRRFKGQSSLRTWIYAIAHHQCLDTLKAERRRHRQVEAREALPEAADAAPGPEYQLVATEISAVLRRCIEKLSANARMAVLARHQMGLTYPEMSAVLGSDAKVLQIRVSRALPALRRCLERAGVRL